MLFVAFPVCTGSNRPLLLIIVYPNEGGVAGYGNRMRVKYTANWGLQIAEMIFQTRSNVASRKFVIRLGIYDKNGKSGILHNKKAYVIMPVSKKKRRVHK